MDGDIRLATLDLRYQLMIREGNGEKLRERGGCGYRV